MTGPASIRRFEALWWGSFAAWLAATVLAWRRTQNVLESAPATRIAAPYTQPVTVALVLLVTLALWFPVARRASNVARWLVALAAALAVLRLVGLVLTLASAPSVHPLSTGLFAVATLLDVAAAFALFRPDADAWFGADDGEELEIVE